MARATFAATILAIALAAGAADAGEAQDRLFATGLLDSVETGHRLVFAHQRSGSAVVGPALAPIENGRVEILLAPSEVSDGRSAEVSLHDGVRVRQLDPVPASAGNPLLMVFMETSVRMMAAATGGSPFYIRNRMRDALRTQDAGVPVEVEIDGATAPGVRYGFRPFAGDPNAGRMGAFADLEFSFVLSDAAPGGFAVLETVAGPNPGGDAAFRETMTFQALEAGR